ncbi:MAG: SMP-30/gluconolactonase/LRE family protein [Ilumatobacteraceae bacterium]
MPEATLLTDGLYFGEGPRWHDGKLWLSDFYDHAVKTIDEHGHVEVMVEVPGMPSGLGWLPDGHLLLVSMTDRRLLRIEAEGPVEHADLSGVATFHTNDMVVDGSGRAYVGNFGFDLDEAMTTKGVEHVIADHATAALARVDPDGSVHVAATDLHFPNGMVITPDGSTMILAETLGFRLTAFDIAADGSLSNRRVWADLGTRVPDGICLDADGNVWVANPLAPECVLVAEGGEVLEVIVTDQPCFACMLGGPDGKTLYMCTAASSVATLARQARSGHVLTARVAVGHAGLP